MLFTSRDFIKYFKIFSINIFLNISKYIKYIY